MKKAQRQKNQALTLLRFFCKLYFLIQFNFIFLSNSFALSPENRLENVQLEERAMQLFLEVKCLTCNGQVIENSESEFAFQMRQLIRNKISQGKSDEQIKKELSDEFGENILTSSSNKKLAGFAFFIMALSLIGAALIIYRRKNHL